MNATPWSLVREFNGVRYYDDSRSTSPEAAIKALSEPKVLIIGSGDNLAQVIDDHNVIHALLIGEETPKIAAALTEIGYTHFTQVQSQGMPALVQICKNITEPGDIVLFGIANPHQAKQFSDAVNVLT